MFIFSVLLTKWIIIRFGIASIAILYSMQAQLQNKIRANQSVKPTV